MAHPSQSPLSIRPLLAGCLTPDSAQLAVSWTRHYVPSCSLLPFSLPATKNSGWWPSCPIRPRRTAESGVVPQASGGSEEAAPPPQHNVGPQRSAMGLCFLGSTSSYLSTHLPCHRGKSKASLFTRTARISFSLLGFPRVCRRHWPSCDLLVFITAICSKSHLSLSS